MAPWTAHAGNTQPEGAVSSSVSVLNVHRAPRFKSLREGRNVGAKVVK